ncbi:MAG: hypothetical protein M1836_007635 [Candelina mexicana]|nr:MAG: hypothetical protein M1836_007635 [Candelina mexicana]
MARKARQRISYVLPLANSLGGHRLGVNGFAVDRNQSILYSGGRDGLLCAWDLDLNLLDEPAFISDTVASHENVLLKNTPSTPRWSFFRRQVQAHTHWVNDIVLAQGNSALISASSDLTVKLWRPHAEERSLPQTIGLHSDYVKCLASPSPHADWVASGGLDHKILLWDLNGSGERLKINVGEEGNTAKGSVYALSVRGSILASGGPESIVRVWDPRSGKRITKFVGHTDNIRAILINQDGDKIITASSDQTVKVWSVTAGRCMHTLTMHNDSVWSLYAEHPQLSVFYSTDRSGLVAKTDVRGSSDLDAGLCVAVCQENAGVNKAISAGGYIWTATSSSSINRWKDINTQVELQTSDHYRHQRVASLVSRPRVPSPSQPPTSTPANGIARTQIPPTCVLRLSNTAPYFATNSRDQDTASLFSATSTRKTSELITGHDTVDLVPFHTLPDESIEGQNGLTKHVMLNDRKRVLTLDTAGEVMMWDLLQACGLSLYSSAFANQLQCIPVKSFGKRHLEDVTPEVNTTESVANWCVVDTRTGRLQCMLEENYCFDAEMYADELELEEAIDFREDQRINLGKWVLRYLFADLIDEEIRRDEAYRKWLFENRTQGRLQRTNAPRSIQVPSSSFPKWQDSPIGLGLGTTPRALNGIQRPPNTPGLSIGVATPAIPVPLLGTHMENHLPTTAEEEYELEKRNSQQSRPRSSNEKPADYFSAGLVPPSTEISSEGAPSTPSEDHEDRAAINSPTAEEKDRAKELSSSLAKKFRMSFGSKKLGRSPVVEAQKPVVPDEKSEVSESSRSSEHKEKVVEDSFYGVIQKIRYAYEEQLQAEPSEPLTSSVEPSLPNDTPVLKLPPMITVTIQEDRPDSGGVADVFRGTIANLGAEADRLETVAPTWLGDLLLHNQIPFKETIKVSFVLQPFQDRLPSIASSDGNSRLNANRMLRARKILAYVAERIEPQPEQPDPIALRPEDYLELYCQNQIVPPLTTLATLRTHVWKGGGDVMLYYKANGRKQILHAEQYEKAADERQSNYSAETGSSRAF